MFLPSAKQVHVYTSAVFGRVDVGGATENAGTGNNKTAFSNELPAITAAMVGGMGHGTVLLLVRNLMKPRPTTYAEASVSPSHVAAPCR